MLFRSVAGLCALLVVKFAQGIVRFVVLFKDISGVVDTLKCLAGLESVVDAIPNAADRVSGTIVPASTS